MARRERRGRRGWRDGTRADDRPCTASPGGALFELAFIAPRLLHTSVDPNLLSRAQRAICSSERHSRSSMTSPTSSSTSPAAVTTFSCRTITHRGSAEERTRIAALGASPAPDGDRDRVVRRVGACGGRERRGRGRARASRSFAGWIWFPTELSHELVRAIVGLDGVDRMRTL